MFCGVEIYMHIYIYCSHRGMQILERVSFAIPHETLQEEGLRFMSLAMAVLSFHDYILSYGWLWFCFFVLH